MKSITPKPLPGVGLLTKYLTREGLSITQFCEHHDLDRIQIQRLLKGVRRRISVTMAKDLQVATNGTVPWDSWIPAASTPESTKPRGRRQRAAAPRQSKKRAS